MTANGLAETLSSDFESMFSLLQSWDADRDGIVSATDFRLGLQVRERRRERERERGREEEVRGRGGSFLPPTTAWGFR